MAATNVDYYFAPGKLGKGNKSKIAGPGILVTQGKFRYKYNRVSKDETRWTMYCVQQTDTMYNCSSKTLVKREEDGFFK